MDFLALCPGRAAREISDALGEKIHPVVNHLLGMTRAGYVERLGADRPYLSRATPAGIAWLDAAEKLQQRGGVLDVDRNYDVSPHRLLAPAFDWSPGFRR